MLDPLRIQSLVDGECTHRERLEILETCDREPRHWKEVALALLEEQEFSKQIHSLRSPRNERSDSVADLLQTSSLAPASLASVNVTSADSHSFSWRPVLAASLVAIAAFVGGRVTRMSTASNGSFANVSKPSSSDVLDWSAGSIASTPAPARDLNQLVMEKGAASAELPEADLRVQIGDYEVPLFDSQDLDPQYVMAKQAFEVQRANQLLRNRGYQLDLKPTFVTGQLEDGRQIVVPFNEVDLRSYGQ